MCMYGLFVPSVYLHALGFKRRHFTIYLMFISAGVNLITSKLRKLRMGSVLGTTDGSHESNLHAVVYLTDKVDLHTLSYDHDG